MHELPVTQSILAIALEAAAGQRVLSIDLVIGDLSSIVDDSVQFYFDILSQDTVAQGAKLQFRREAAGIVCWDCQQRSNVQAPLPQACPVCGGRRLQVVGGRDFRVESIDVEESVTP